MAILLGLSVAFVGAKRHPERVAGESAPQEATGSSSAFSSLPGSGSLSLSLPAMAVGCFDCYRRAASDGGAALASTSSRAQVGRGGSMPLPHEGDIWPPATRPSSTGKPCPGGGDHRVQHRHRSMGRVPIVLMSHDLIQQAGVDQKSPPSTGPGGFAPPPSTGVTYPARLWRASVSKRLIVAAPTAQGHADGRSVATFESQRGRHRTSRAPT
jgi:hypothetical protein